MTVGDLIFYVLDAAILFMLYRMYQASKTIEIKTSVGPRWVIPAMFWAIALLGLFNYRGAFRIIQTIALAVMGAIYWTFDSGLSKKGLVMIGRLYPYEKIKPITVDEANHFVNFTIRKVPTAIFFLPEQMRDVQNYLSHHAGVAKRTAKARTKTAPAKPKEEDKKKAEA